jgi:TonB family protein
MILIEKRTADWMISKPDTRQTLVPIEIAEKNAPSEDEKSQRIVETEQVAPSQVAPKDAYLGKQNQWVTRETVSRGGKTAASGTSASKSRTSSVSKNAPEKGAQRSRTLSHLGVPLFSLDSIRSPTQAEPEKPRWASDGAGGDVPKDYIDGVKESERTALNTREYIFFGYFQRIRNRLDVAWTSSLRARLEKLYRRGRRLASAQDHKTRTWVTLDSVGKVVRVRLVEESGVLDLDEAAIAAFNDAGPFPNPPKGLVDERGQIELHWDFVLRN